MDYGVGMATQMVQAKEALQGYPEQIRPAGDVSRIVNDLSEITAHVEQMRALASKMANELFGAPPPAPVPPGIERANKMGGVEGIHSQIETLRVELAGLYQAMERFQRLARWWLRELFR